MNRPFHEAFASLILAALLLLLVPLKAGAQGADTVSVRVALEGITVEESVDEGALFRGRMSLQRTSLAAQASHQVYRLLEHVPGLDVQRQGNSGAALASFRGLGAASTHIELDGIRLVDPATGTFDLSTIPAALVHGATVTSGASAGFTPGGVIALKSPASLPAALSLATGSFGERLMNVQGGISNSKTTLSGAATRSVEDGDFPFTHPVLLGNPRVRREGADRSQTAVFLSAQHTFRADSERQGVSLSERTPPVHVRFLGLGTRVDRSLPTLSNTRGAGAQQEDDLLLVGLNIATTLRSMPVQATISATRTHFFYAAPDQPASRVQLRELALRGGLSRVFKARWVVSIEPAWKRSSVASSSRWDVTEAWIRTSMDSVQDRIMMGAYVDARWRNTAVLQGIGAPLEGNAKERDVAMAPGAWWGIRTRWGGEMRLAVARIFRLPTLNERFWEPGGNSDLRPERGQQVEWLVAYRPSSGRLFARVVLFGSRISDRIVWRPAFAGTQRRIWTPDNVARVSGRGLEAFGRWRIAQPWTLTVSGTRLRQVDYSNKAAASYGRQLRFVAPWSATSEAEYRRGQSGLFASWRLTSRRFTSTDQSTWLPSHHVFDAGIAWHAAHERVPISFRLTASNLLDAAYESSPWMPMPGRAWHLALRLGK